MLRKPQSTIFFKIKPTLTAEQAEEEKANFSSSIFAPLCPRVALADEKKAEVVGQLKIPICTDVLRYELFKCLDLRSQAMLAKSSMQFWTLPEYSKAVADFDAQFVALTQDFLNCVAKGKQLQAEIMLKNNSDLVLARGWVRDYSNRNFRERKLSAIQYAAWAYDIPMLQMLLSYIPEAKLATALLQLDELETVGTEYGSHYDFSPLIGALQVFVDYMKNVGTSDFNLNEAARLVVQVLGRALREVPAHVAEEYLRPRNPADLRSSFEEVSGSLRNKLSFFSWLSAREESWFPLMSDTGLGFNYGILWGGRCIASEGGGPMVWINEEDDGSEGLAALTLLAEVRMRQLSDLKDGLKDKLKPALTPLGSGGH